MTWRHLSMNSRLNLPASVFSFRYAIKDPLKSPLNSYFSFCACDFRGDQMRWKKISANVAVACEECRESVGNCAFFLRRRRSFAPGQFDCPKSCYKGQVKNAKQSKLLLSL